MSLERVHRYADAEELARGMAGQLVTRLVELQQLKPRVHLALTGGETATRLYESFGYLAQAAKLDTARLEIWWTSERWVPTTDPQRNSTRALSYLAATLPDPAQVHPMPSNTGTSDPAAAALLYANELGETVFDICLLGVGTDGHIASIYPNHPSFTSQADSSQMVIGVDNAPIPPSQRVSLTLKQINQSSEIWLMACGTEKSLAVSRALQHDPALPAALVHASDITRWFVDEAAAARLPRYYCAF